MLTAMSGGVPDRVPASPDTNWTIPAKLALRGEPFWKIYRYGDPPLWKAYHDCVRHFGIDGFSHHGYYHVPGQPNIESRSEMIFQSDERLVFRDSTHTPYGDLVSETTYLNGEPPSPTLKPIYDFEKQFDALCYTSFGQVDKINFDGYRQVRADMGDDGVVGLCMNLPTLLTYSRQPTEGAFYDYFDHHDLLVKYIRLWEDYLVRISQAIIDQDVKPDFVFFPNSGMVTMQSVKIMQEFSLPSLRRLTAMFKKAGVLTSLHCCGKERAVVEAAAETDLDCIDPLEVAPMGDCDLREIKRKFGRTLALKGNLHTTEVMLRMTPEGVEREARKCLADAMEGGGYVLGTGDQCGRDTPEANITRLVEVCEKYGKY
jgi:uroporphyrinogen decarboxylase